VKICFICSEYPPGPHGGIGTMTQVLSRALAAEGHEVQSIGVYPQNYPGPDREEDNGVRIRRLRGSGRPFEWAFHRLRLYRDIAGLARRGAVDLVEAPDYEGWVAGWQRLSAPVVVRLHGSQTYFASELGKRVRKTAFALERSALRRADFWCSVCRYTAERTRELFALTSEPSAILYNPVEVPDLPTAQSRHSQRVVFSGTLTPKKGIISLADAWPMVLAKCSNAELHIYGKDGRTEAGGSMREHLRRRLGEAARSVSFHGHVSREALFQAYFHARVAVFPSHAEAFAMAPLESMACECPTIYSRRGSGPELLAHGREGLLIDPDQPEEIAAAIVRVIEEDAFAARMGRRARQHVIDKFSVQTLVRKNVEFYRDALQRFQAPHAKRVAVAV